MYFSPALIFFVTALIVLINLAIYAIFLLPAFLIYLNAGLFSETPRKRHRLAIVVGVLSIAAAAFAVPTISYFWAVANYNVQITDNVSDRELPTRPREVSLVIVDHNKSHRDFETTRVSVIARAECGAICQELLLSEEASAVNIQVTNGREFVTATYRLERKDFCDSTPFSFAGKPTNAVMAAALHGKCIVADPWVVLPNAVTISLATNPESDDKKHVTITQADKILFKNTAVKMKAYARLLLFVPDGGIETRDIYFGTWFDKNDRDNLFISLLKSKLGFSLAIPSEYANSRGRDNLRAMLALKTEAPFPAYFDQYAAYFCLQVADVPDAAPEKREMVEVFTEILMDKRLSLSGTGRCSIVYEHIIQKNFAIAVGYYSKFHTINARFYARHDLLKGARSTIVQASNSALQFQSDAVFDIVTKLAPEDFVALWPRLGILGTNDPSHFLLDRATRNNSASTEAIVGICNANKKWASSFLPQLEKTLLRLDIFTANAKGAPKISLITGAAALTRFGDPAASQRLVERLPEDLREKAQAEITKIAADTGEMPCSSYLN